MPIDRQRLEAAIVELNRITLLYTWDTYEGLDRSMARGEKYFGYSAASKCGDPDLRKVYAKSRMETQFSNHQRVQDIEIRKNLDRAAAEVVAATGTSPVLDHAKLRVEISLYLHPKSPRIKMEIDGMAVSPKPLMMAGALDRLETTVNQLEQLADWSNPLQWTVTFPFDTPQIVAAPSAGAAIIKRGRFIDPDVLTKPHLFRQATVALNFTQEEIGASLDSLLVKTEAA
jgi:hypothetical protein